MSKIYKDLVISSSYQIAFQNHCLNHLIWELETGRERLKLALHLRLKKAQSF